MDYRILTKIILLGVLLASIGYLCVSSDAYSCDQCSVTFSNPKVSGISMEKGIKIYMSELFEESKLNDCPIYWDRVSGYVKK